MNTTIEPEPRCIERHQHTLFDDPFAFTEADQHIYKLLQAGPQRVTTVINKVARILPSTSKRQRTAIQRQTLLRVTTLIRRGKLRRNRRIFVGLMLPLQWNMACKLKAEIEG